MVPTSGPVAVERSKNVSFVPETKRGLIIYRSARSLVSVTTGQYRVLKLSVRRQWMILYCCQQGEMPAYSPLESKSYNVICMR